MPLVFRLIHRQAPPHPPGRPRVRLAATLLAAGGGGGGTPPPTRPRWVWGNSSGGGAAREGACLFFSGCFSAGLPRFRGGAGGLGGGRFCLGRGGGGRTVVTVRFPGDPEAQQRPPAVAAALDLRQ